MAHTTAMTHILTIPDLEAISMYLEAKKNRDHVRGIKLERIRVMTRWAVEQHGAEMLKDIPAMNKFIFANCRDPRLPQYRGSNSHHYAVGSPKAQREALALHVTELETRVARLEGR